MKPAKVYSNPIILFDGVCNLCNHFVNFMVDADKQKQFRYTSLQSAVGKEVCEQYDYNHLELSSVLLLHNGILYRESTAVLKMMQLLGGGYVLLYGFIIIPTFIRDGVYKYIARNRYRWFGEKDTCRLPTPEERSLFL